MDSKGRNVIVCDNGTGVRIEIILFFLQEIEREKKMDAFVKMIMFGMGPLRRYHNKTVIK